jgi:hypothetical protein
VAHTGDQQLPDAAVQDGADDVQVGQLDAAGFPDHSPDIFPALMTAVLASIRCSSLAFQMPRLAAASRRFHLIAVPPGRTRAARAACPAVICSAPRSHFRRALLATIQASSM